MVCREDGNVTQINRTSPCRDGASRNFWPRDCFIVLAYLWIQIFWITVHSDAPVVFFSFHSYRSSNRTTRFFYVMKRRGTNANCSSFTSMFECGSRSFSFFFSFFLFLYYTIWLFRSEVQSCIFGRNKVTGFSFENFLPTYSVLFLCSLHIFFSSYELSVGC